MNQTTRENLRSKSWKRQPEYDKLLADTDPSGLKFLKLKYEKDLNSYLLYNDLNNPDNFSEYKEMQQRYKMICEELERRYYDTLLLDNKDIHFSEDYEYVVSEDKWGNREVWDVCYDENESVIKSRRIGNVEDTET